MGGGVKQCSYNEWAGLLGWGCEWRGLWGWASLKEQIVVARRKVPTTRAPSFCGARDWWDVGVHHHESFNSINWSFGPREFVVLHTTLSMFGKFLVHCAQDSVWTPERIVSCIGPLRAKHVLGGSKVLKWVWPPTSRYRMLFVQTSTLPTSKHGTQTYQTWKPPYAEQLTP